MILFQIFQSFDFNQYVMMEEKQLKKYPLFRKLGAFSVVRENPREAIESLDYAVRKLKENPRNVLMIFPQGKIVHNDHRPIEFFNGIARIVENIEHCLLASISIRLEFLREFKPVIFVNCTNVEEIRVNPQFSSKQFTKTLASKMTVLMDDLKNDILNNNTKNYRNILD